MKKPRYDSKIRKRLETKKSTLLNKIEPDINDGSKKIIFDSKNLNLARDIKLSLKVVSKYNFDSEMALIVMKNMSII